MKTMGQRITKLRPIDGFCAETAAASSIFLSTHLGIPVSTTHVITGAISGVGSVNRVSAVRWGVTLRIVWAWIFTIPAAAVIGLGLYYLIHTVYLAVKRVSSGRPGWPASPIWRLATIDSYCYLMMRLKDVEARVTNTAVASTVIPKSMAKWL